MRKKDIPFSKARDTLYNRGLAVAIDCKNVRTGGIGAEVQDVERGFLVTPYTPADVGISPACRILGRDAISGKLVGGGWTNCYAALTVYSRIWPSKDGQKFLPRSRQRFIKFSHLPELFDCAERVLRWCLVFPKGMHLAPVVAMHGARGFLLFRADVVDALVSLHIDCADELEFFFNRRQTGVVLCVFGLPLAYLGRVRLPEHLDGWSKHQAVRFFRAHCGD